MRNLKCSIVLSLSTALTLALLAACGGDDTTNPGSGGGTADGGQDGSSNDDAAPPDGGGTTDGDTPDGDVPDGDTPDGGGTPDADPPDGDTPDVDGGSPTCVCADGEVCTTKDVCIEAPAPQDGHGYAELILLRQYRPGDTSIMGNVGTATVDLDLWEPLPQDNRVHYTSVDGEDCAVETDTNYPYWYNEQSWPSDPGRGAGKVTFKPAGAPSPGLIEIEPLDMDPGWAYFHDDVPPALTQGAGTYRDFFEPDNIPFDAPFEVQFEGGPDIGSMTIAGGRTSQEFQIVEPAAEAPGATVPNDAPLTVRWSPAQPGATMEVFVVQSFGGSAVLLSCKADDDGEITLPVSTIGSFLGEVSLQLRRTVTRYSEVQLLNGQPMHVYLMGRHARLGRITFQN